MSKDSDQAWTILIQSLAIAALGPVGTIGTIIFNLVNAINTNGGQSNSGDSMNHLFDSLLVEFKEIVDQEIIADDMQTLKLSMQSYATNLDTYSKNESISVKGDYLNILRAGGIDLLNQLTGETPNNRQAFFYPVTAAFMPLHMSVLREWIFHGSELYGNDFNRKQAEQELEEAVDHYKSYITSTYSYLFDWRNDKLSYHPWTSPHIFPSGHYVNAKYTDELASKESHTYTDTTLDDDDAVAIFKPVISELRSFVMSQWQLKFASTCVPFNYIDYYKEDGKMGPPLSYVNALNTIKVSPCSYFYADMEDSCLLEDLSDDVRSTL